jgi:tRNA(Ile)-lysidine synthase
VTNDDTVIAALGRALESAPSGPLCVGFSGGLDSTVLLHAMSALPTARKRGLSAIHVDHGLHPESSHWAAHCAALCASLQLPLQVARVHVDDGDGLGLEAAARRARHAAFRQHLPAGSLLALAQHRDDQAETLLLRLLHGGGHEGMAGMRGLRAFGAGWLWRPLLALGREALSAYAHAQGLRWIEDPSNTDARHARNHLRLTVLPALRSRWPDAAQRITASAMRLRQESDLVDRLARETLAAAQGVDPAVLSLRAMRALSDALRRRVIGLWLDQLGLPRPPPGVWLRIAPDLIEARADRAPLIAWRGAELRRYRDELHAMRALPPPTTGWTLPWDGSGELVLPAAFGKLVVEPAMAFGAWRVAPRIGGERLAQPGANRELRTLLQDLGVPPWVRDRLPLVFDDSGELLAAADLALAPRFAAQLGQAGARLRWHRAD